MLETQRSKVSQIAQKTTTTADVGSPSAKGQYAFQWQFLENDNLWKDVRSDVSDKLDGLPFNQSVKYSYGQWTYTVSKTSAEEAIQTNEITQNQRDLRQILVDRQNGKRVVCLYFDPQVQLTAVHAPFSLIAMKKLMELPISTSLRGSRGRHKCTYKKVGAMTCSEINEQTKAMRQYQFQMTQRDAMDNGWTSQGTFVPFIFFSVH